MVGDWLPIMYNGLHQSLHYIVADAPWSDEAVLDRRLDFLLPAMGAGREWLGAVFQEPSHSSTARSFSKTMQRQFAGEPIGAKPLSLSPPHW